MLLSCCCIESAVGRLAPAPASQTHVCSSKGIKGQPTRSPPQFAQGKASIQQNFRGTLTRPHVPRPRKLADACIQDASTHASTQLECPTNANVGNQVPARALATAEEPTIWTGSPLKRVGAIPEGVCGCCSCGLLPPAPAGWCCQASRWRYLGSRMEPGPSSMHTCN
jgi:hypothetical protein